MAGIPIMRRYTKPNAGTLNVQELATDDITGLTFTQLSRANNILDAFNDPTLAGQTYQFELFKNSISTGRFFFSGAMDTASAGRAAVGPVALAMGQLQLGITQTGGTAIATSLVLKFANGF